MDLQQFIQQDANGTFCILFQNKAALTLSEINEIFSKFGKIHSIQSSGDERGYRFVRYNTYDEVKIAVLGLNNHPQIKLGHHKKNRDQKTSPNVNNKVRDETKFKKTSNFVHNENSKQKRRLKNDENKNSNNSSRMSDYSEQGSKTTKNNYIREKLKSDSSEQINNQAPNLVNGNNSENKKTLKSGNDKTLNDSSEEEIPNLINLNGKIAPLNMSKKIIISNAEEVVVGNIPPNFGPPYILYLFDNYEPIAITKINELKNRIRYCNVYFKTAEDSIAVESKFDKMELSGHKLLVLRPYRLIQEALD